MSESYKWHAYKPGFFRRWVIQRVLWTDWAGTDYTFWRDSKGNVVRFWSREEAEFCAKELNEQAEFSRRKNHDR